MMLDILRKALEQSSADDWEITVTDTRGWEFYFIRHDLDQNRAKDLKEIKVKVYKNSEDGEWMGSAEAAVSPTASENELYKLVDDLIFQASLVRNCPYELVGPSDEAPDAIDSPSLAMMSEAYISAVRSVPETETEDINSYEIFTDHVTRRIMNSRGVDVTMRYPTSMAEVVVNARKEGHEVELYRMYTGGTCDEQGLRDNLVNTLQYGRDRLHTQPTPELGEAEVLFSTDDAMNIYWYYLDNLNASYVYRKMSSFEIGKPVAENVSGDKVTLKAVRYLPNSSRNGGFDDEGSCVHDRTLMESNVPQAYWGSRMFSQYLGLEESFKVRNWVIEGGTHSDEEMRAGDYLEIVEFSDFQVDGMTGDIFGEIRLGYLHRNGEVMIVSGGSISGDMKENLADIRMSSRQTQYDNARIPALTRLAHVTVTGVNKD